MRFHEYISEAIIGVTQEIYNEDDYRRLKVPSDVIEAFVGLGQAQRGAPEAAMLRVQRANGGGVLNPVVEHAGDLTHRMTHHANFGNLYPEIIRDKTEKVLDRLTYPYGFEREHSENIESNARYRNVDPNTIKTEVDRLLRVYADEHRKLKVYNKAQHMAKYAAVAIGSQNWDDAIWFLDWLHNLSKNESEFYIEAGKVYRDSSGKILTYPL